MIFDFMRLGTVLPRSDRHRLAGTVSVDGLPAKKLVTVFHKSTETLVAAQWSDAATGTWAFHGLPQYPERSLRVEAQDETGAYNAAVADFITQVTG